VGVARASSVPTLPTPAPASSFSALAPHGRGDEDDVSLCRSCRLKSPEYGCTACWSAMVTVVDCSGWTWTGEAGAERSGSLGEVLVDDADVDVGRPQPSGTPPWMVARGC